MEYKGEFTIEDFEEVVRLLNEPPNHKRKIMRFWPITKEEDRIMKEMIAKGHTGLFFIDEI